MSSLERNKGTLVFLAQGTEDIEYMAMDLLDNCLLTSSNSYTQELIDEGTPNSYKQYMIINNKLYDVMYDVMSDTDCGGFQEVVGDVHGDRDIDFHTLHHNGGGSLQEVLADEIERMIIGDQ